MANPSARLRALSLIPASPPRPWALVWPPRQLLNLRGEKTSEEALGRAVRAALPAASVAEFSAAERTESAAAPPHYLVLVEAARDQPALPADAAARLEAAPARYQPRVDVHMRMSACACTCTCAWTR